MEDILKTVLEEIIATGITGVFVVLLILAIIFIVRRMWAKDKEHADRIDKFTDVMQQHATNEAQQTEVLRDFKTLLQGHLLKSN